MSDLIEPSNTDLGDSPDNVRKYVEDLEFQLGLSETENTQLKQRIEQLELNQEQNNTAQQIKGVEDALKAIPETRYGNWKRVHVLKYLRDIKKKLVSGFAS